MNKPACAGWHKLDYVHVGLAQKPLLRTQQLENKAEFQNNNSNNLTCFKT